MSATVAEADKRVCRDRAGCLIGRGLMAHVLARLPMHAQSSTVIKRNARGRPRHLSTEGVTLGTDETGGTGILREADPDGIAWLAVGWASDHERITT